MKLDELPEETILIQLAEECGELTQACAKLLRSWTGDTPVSPQDCRQSLLEEIADVEVCMDVLRYKLTPMEIQYCNVTYRDKINRWKERIAEKR